MSDENTLKPVRSYVGAGGGSITEWASTTKKSAPTDDLLNELKERRVTALSRIDHHAALLEKAKANLADLDLAIAALSPTNAGEEALLDDQRRPDDLSNSHTSATDAALPPGYTAWDKDTPMTLDNRPSSTHDIRTIDHRGQHDLLRATDYGLGYFSAHGVVGYMLVPAGKRPHLVSDSALLAEAAEMIAALDRGETELQEPATPNALAEFMQRPGATQWLGGGFTKALRCKDVEVLFRDGRILQGVSGEFTLSSASEFLAGGWKHEDAESGKIDEADDIIAYRIDNIIAYRIIKASEPASEPLSKGEGTDDRAAKPASPEADMDIHSPPGTKAVFAFPDHGYEGDRRYAAQHLTVGATYTVYDMNVGGFHTTVELEELPGKRFNSVLFAPFVEAEAAPHNQPALTDGGSDDDLFERGQQGDDSETITGEPGGGGGGIDTGVGAEEGQDGAEVPEGFTLASEFICPVHERTEDAPAIEAFWASGKRQIGVHRNGAYYFDGRDAPVAYRIISTAAALPSIDDIIDPNLTDGLQTEEFLDRLHSHTLGNTFEQGRLAFATGWTRDQNPYVLGGVDYPGWDTGWRVACDEHNARLPDEEDVRGILADTDPPQVTIEQRTIIEDEIPTITREEIPVGAAVETYHDAGVETVKIDGVTHIVEDEAPKYSAARDGGEAGFWAAARGLTKIEEIA